jgi:hypothetical protein
MVTHLREMSPPKTSNRKFVMVAMQLKVNGYAATAFAGRLHECTQYFEVANWGGDCVRIS